MSGIRQKRYNIMLVENLMATSEEDLFKFEQKGAGLDNDNTLIFQEITKEQEKVTTLIRQAVFSTL